MLESLITTCKKLEKDWDRERFPDLAKKTLEKLIIEPSLEEFEKEVSEWLNNNDLVPQLNLYNNFGEPSLTVFNNGKFALDIYFWRKNDTLIHSHGFRGAFKIMYGLSLHEDFVVETLNTFSKDILNTKLTQKNIKVMKPGDSQQINPDMELTHRVVHLGDPTVSLCLRTVEDTELNQWHHLTTGLSFQKKHVSEKTIKRSLYFQYLLKSDEKKAKDFYQKLLDELSSAEQISLYEAVCFDQVGLDEETTETAAEILFESFIGDTWFGFYEAHFDKLEQNLQESLAGSPALKLLAHAINNDFAKKQVVELLSEISDQSLDELCEELKNSPEVFVEGFGGSQLDTIEHFKIS